MGNPYSPGGEELALPALHAEPLAAGYGTRVLVSAGSPRHVIARLHHIKNLHPLPESDSR
jgi:hypothetical protein